MKKSSTKNIILLLITIGSIFMGINSAKAADYQLRCVYVIDNSNAKTFPSEVIVEQKKNGEWKAEDSKGKQKFTVKIKGYSSTDCPDYIGLKSNTVYLTNKNETRDNYKCEGSGYASDVCKSASYTKSNTKSDETNKSETSGNPKDESQTGETDFPESACGILGEKSVGLLKQGINLVRYLVPVIIIIYGSIDFSKIMFSGEEKVFKGAASTFLKRILIGACFIFVPFIIELLINLSGLLLEYDVDQVFCGIF